MSRRSSFLLIWLIVLHFNVSGQDIVLKGVVKIDGVPLSNGNISFINVATATTNENGYFTRALALPKGEDEIHIEVPAGLSLISPVDGVLDVGKASRLITILFSRDAKKSMATKALSRGTDLIIESPQNSKAIEEKLDQILAKFDEDHRNDFSKEEIELIRASERRRLELKYAKANILPILNGAFDHYLSRTRDLRDEFRRRGSKVFYDVGQNISEINRRILAYSEAYEELNKSRAFFVANLETYWTDPYLKIKITNLLSGALDSFHKGQVLRYNILLNDIDNYNQNVKGKRRRPEIQHDIDEYVDMLSQNVDILERDKAAVVQQLLDAGDSL